MFSCMSSKKSCRRDGRACRFMHMPSYSRCLFPGRGEPVLPMLRWRRRGVGTHMVCEKWREGRRFSPSRAAVQVRW